MTIIIPYFILSIAFGILAILDIINPVFSFLEKYHSSHIGVKEVLNSKKLYYVVFFGLFTLMAPLTALAIVIPSFKESAKQGILNSLKD